MSLELKPINRRSADFPKVKQLFSQAFPKDEQVPMWYLLFKARRQNVDFFGLYDNQRWVGLTYTITHQKVTYVFFLAIDPNNRSQGYGSQALAAVKARYPGNKIGLVIEEVKKAAANYEQRLRRKQFYQKNGFAETDFTLTEGKTDYEFMSTNGVISPFEYMGLMRDYGGTVLQWYIKTKIHVRPKSQVQPD